MDEIIHAPEKINALAEFFKKISESNLALAAAFFFLLTLIGWLFFGKSHEYYRVFAFVAMLASGGAILYGGFGVGGGVKDACDYEIVSTGGPGPQPYDPGKAFDKDSGDEVVPEPDYANADTGGRQVEDFIQIFRDGGEAEIVFDESACNLFDFGSISCASKYTVSLDATSNTWTVTGYNQYRSHDFRGTCSGSRTKNGEMNVWGVTLSFKRNGELFYRNSQVGALH